MRVVPQPTSPIAIVDESWGIDAHGLWVGINFTNVGQKTLKTVQLEMSVYSKNSTKIYDHVFTAFPFAWRFVFMPAEGASNVFYLGAENPDLFGPNTSLPALIVVQIATTTAADGSVWPAQASPSPNPS